jgi:hypothetical protein
MGIRRYISKRDYTSSLLGKKGSFIFILVFTAVVVVDSTIVDFSSYSGVEASRSVNTMIFIVFSIIFIASGTILLKSVRRSIYTSKSQPISLRYSHWMIIGIQITSIIIILMIIFQMLILNQYSLALLKIQTYVSHISALVFLSFLVFLFARWFTSKRSYAIILYAISLSLISINLVVSLTYIESYLSSTSLSTVKPYPIVSYVTNFSGVFSFGNVVVSELLSTVFDIFSLSSFLLMWIATAILLSQYRYKMGRIKYFSLMSIPLIYYIFPFQNYFGDTFLSLLQSSPAFFSVIYVLIFSATKQFGALVFSLSFWTASSLIHNEQIRKFLLISSIGMVILFGSIEIKSLQYHVFPPFGLVTEAFTPLGTYLLFIGIFISAKNISRDAEVRKQFYNNASSQLTLLKTIGVSQMERELESQVKFVEKHTKLLEKTTTEEPDLKEEEVRLILHDVLNELYYSKDKKNETQKS